MKTKEQLKKELHEYIDSITDEETLMMVHEDVTSYLKKESEVEEDDELTEEQEKQLAEAIRQADAGEFISEEEYLKATARWRTK